jgi:hypothetical protein
MNASSEESFLVLRKFKSESPTVQLLFVWGVTLPTSRALFVRASGKVSSVDDGSSHFVINGESGFFFSVGVEDWSFEYGTSKEAPTAELTALLKPSEEIEDLVMGRSPFGTILWVFTLKESSNAAAV